MSKTKSLTNFLISFQLVPAQALHRARVLTETDFQHICEENNLRDKLYALEELCEEQGIAETDAPAETRYTSPVGDIVPATSHINRYFASLFMQATEWDRFQSDSCSL